MIIAFTAWLSLTVIGHSTDISSCKEFKINSRDIHSEIKTTLSELRQGQKEILQLLIE